MHEVIYGDFHYIPDTLVPEAQMDMTVNPVDLRTHWQRCGLLSDMTAGYIAYAYSEGMKGHRSAIFSSISTIFQELIENAARYSRQREAEIKVRVRHYNRVVQIEVQNDATPGFAERFESHVKVLMATEDLESMYIQQMEEQALGNRQAGIGLLLLLKDYPVKVGVRFVRGGADCETVVVRAHYHMELSEEDLLSGYLAM